MTTHNLDYKTEQQLMARGRRMRAEAFRDFFRAVVSLFSAKPARKAGLGEYVA